MVARTTVLDDRTIASESRDLLYESIQKAKNSARGH